MKLHKLILTNIGPYAGRSELDFDSLDNSLFLITGATGAGKTYIFDSICYALYGKTSGENREPDDLKSKFAGQRDIASIDLYFEYQNKNYFIHREPIQWRLNEKKTNGEYQMSRRSATGAIYLLPDDKKPIVSTGLDKYITELFGLDFSQFKMTMMIAQGDFYSLINADTKKREEIFRKILNTDKLAQFSKRLDEKAKEMESGIREGESAIKAIRSGFSFDGELQDNTLNPNYDASLLLPLIEDELKLEENERNSSLAELNEKKNIMLKALENYNNAELNNRNLDAYLKAKEKMDDYNKDLPEYKMKASLLELSDKASQYKSILDSYNEVNDSLIKLNTDKNSLVLEINKNEDLLKKLNNSLAIAKEMVAKNDKLIKENTKIDDQLSKILDFKNLNNKLANINEELNLLNAKRLEALEPLEELNKDKNELELIINGDDKSIELNNVENTIKNIDFKIAEFKKKRVILDKYIKLIDAYKARYDDYNNKNLIYKAALEAYEQYEHNYHSSLAGILAANLNDNEPCPVCGSIHHPRKAILTTELSKAELDRLKNVSDNALNNKNKSDNIANAALADVNNAYDNIKEFIPEFNADNVYSKFEDLIADMELEKNPYLKERDELSLYVNKYNDAKAKLILIDKRIDDINKSINDIDSQINNKELERSETSGSINQLSDISDLDEELLKNKLLENNSNIAKNKAAYENAANNYNAVEKDLSANRASLSVINSNIDLNKQKLLKLEDDLNKALEDGGFESKEKALESILPSDIYEKYKVDGSNYRVEALATSNLLNRYIKEGYDKLIIADLEELNNLKEEANSIHSDANNKYIEINSKYDNNLKQYKLLCESIKASQGARSKYLEVKQLADVANGKVNKKRINFEVYYQLQVFDEILKVASYKFNKMSNGRYEMRAGLPKGGNGQIGLEIDVKDLYNGEVRPVSGLSGGESFQASMALALAFSEIIQFKAGGIELNSMFIDEGFGTLDNEMLESTKKTLLEIGNATNRRIGIISHIEELVRSISSKVIVTKTDKGSHFEIMNN